MRRSTKAPNHPKALWYGSIAALQAGDLRSGRDRLQLLLAQNPPEELRGVLERQIQDLESATRRSRAGCACRRSGRGRREARSASGAALDPGRRVDRTADSRATQRRAAAALHPGARSSAGGPPLAVQRHSSSDLPLTVELSERDAMIAARTIATVPRVQVVARLSRSGTPQAQSGDFYGEAEYDFSKNAARART